MGVIVSGHEKLETQMMVTIPEELKSSRFEDGHIQNLDPLEIVNVGTVPEKLRQAHVVISAEQKSQGSPGDQQI